MSFAQTHAELWYSPKFTRLSFAARGLWVTCQSWCAGQLTDGLIPERDVKDIGGSDAQIRALVNSGLWEVVETEGGERAYQFHDWLDHNESATKISTRKRKEKERKAAQRAKKSAQDLTETAGGSDPSLTQTSTKSDSDSTQTSGKSGGSFQDGTPFDQQESESVPGGKGREENRTETGTKHNSPTGSVSARPPGGALTEPETETKDGSEEQELKGSPILSDPRFSPNTLSSRLSALKEGSAVVDVSASEDQGSAPEPKPLEQMTPKELLDYIETFQREVNGLPQDGGPAGVSTMKKFQEDYGPERAAAIIRELFVEHEGRCKVGKEVEPISYRHFSVNLRWFTDRIDIALQVKAKSESYVRDNFVFASEL